MKRKLTIWVFFAPLFTAMLLHAQVLPSVDIDTAQTQVSQFLKENELLQERIELLLATNDALREDIILTQSWLGGVESVSERLLDSASQLIDLLDELASKLVMERAQSVLDRYNRLESILNEKAQELNRRRVAAETSIERNTSVVADLERKSMSNLENIELLKAAIERSAGSEETVNAYIESLEQAIDEAEKALIQPF